MLPRKLGGIAVPDLKAELLALAAVTTNKWALDASPEAQIVGDVLTSPAGAEEVSYFRGKITQKWRGRRLWLETSSRRGPLWRAALDAEAQRTVA
ncbi:hypothetical protein PF002_g32709 [Phytophthora fragariae]|uniref:Uncharacterized protein n=1 Tax=Phytophthora fragariae TaxID=53985 RepID=A0A6A3V2V8_9STRA|nr:hypothetical protein PF007_g31517 [Phytophthora fragariae]KAE9160061.1 hypothetical protein PF002_g32709 [Phytophthora fragariae]